MIEAIVAVYKGDSFFSQGISRILVDESKTRPQRKKLVPTGGLSLCEQEVLRFIAEGHINKEIAKRLSINVRTVETHREHITGKLGSRDAARCVIR